MHDIYMAVNLYLIAFVYLIFIWSLVAEAYYRTKIDVVCEMELDFIKKMFDFDVVGMEEDDAIWRIRHAGKWCDIMRKAIHGER